MAAVRYLGDGGGFPDSVEPPFCFEFIRRGRFRTDPLCRRPRFLYAFLAWQDPPKVRHAVCRADRTRGRIDDSGGDQFFFYGHGSAGNVSEVVVPRRGAAIDPVSLYVWRPAED